MTKQDRYEKAMYRFFRHIQDQVERMPHWMDYDSYPVDIDVFEFNRFVNTLGKPSNAERWHGLHEKHGGLTRQEHD